VKAKKSFGQNWLRDEYTLGLIVESAEIKPKDTVLEVGPGLGYLTNKLAKFADQVVCIEADQDLIPHLNHQFGAVSNIKIIQADILKYNLTKLPKDYLVVANIPYYLTSNLIRQLLESNNPPLRMVLMVQKEVAERIVATPGQMSVLSFSVQYYAEAKIIAPVSKELFEPIPKVDSAIIKIKRRQKPAFNADTKKLFRLVKAGFGERRKMLRNSLAGGLQLDSMRVEKLLQQSDIKPTTRAQELSMKQWQSLYEKFITI
jgi:16S rRNA (adenine1518-N6/adenine1519-N6)-dimethyltransferase